MRWLFLLASGREWGNSEGLARHAARELSGDHEVTFLRLGDYPLAPFRDYRRAMGPAEMPVAAAEEVLLHATLAAEAIILAVPVYWYGLPAPAKLYLDYWSKWMRVPGVRFRDSLRGKELGAICAMASARHEEAAPLAEQLRLTAGYMGMGWRGMCLTAGVAEAGEVLEDSAALRAAGAYLSG